MNFLKRLPWVTILVVAFVALKFYPKIMETLRQKAPSLANTLEPNTPTESDIAAR